MQIRSVLLFAIAVLVSGCSPLSKHYCQAADWQAVGFAGGTTGKAPGEVRKYWQGCDKRGVTMDLNAYADGYNAGLVQYCTEPHGYQAGLQGEPYREVCQGTLEGDFLSGYAQGRKIYDSKMRVE